jgi:hypothetical protein
VAAAQRLGRYGFKVILTEETAWIGGQLTSQAVPPDEHGWIEQFGCTRAYRDFRNRVRQAYLDSYPVKSEFRADPFFNPGNGWVSPICHEPTVAHRVLNEMLRPAVQDGNLEILLHTRARELTMSGNHRVGSAILEDTRTRESRVVEFAYILDASENGDLLPLANTAFTTGSESHVQTGEAGAGPVARPSNVQALSWCFVMEHHEGENHCIQKPDTYDFWSAFIPELDPPWPGKLLSWETPNPRTLEKQTYAFRPHEEEMGFLAGLWTFRRILDRSQFEEGAFASDRVLVNWPMIDYLGGDILTCDSYSRDQHLQSSRELSLSLFYWLQTEAPRADGGNGFPGLRLCPEATGTPDGLAMAPYIRESRRIVALKTILEQEVSAAYRPGETYAASYEDSVGIGYYRIDLHPSTGGDNYIDVPSLPFQIPLGALIPVETENLLPACKNVGSTHITNGCYRLHPVEWNIGEAVGALTAFCLELKVLPVEVARDKDLRQTFQDHLRQTGVELEWPEGLNLDHSDPHRHAMPDET